MKRVFIMLFALGVTTAVFAQRNDHNYGGYGRTEAPVTRNDRDANRRGDYGYGAYDSRQAHDVEMARINREYDQRIAAVQYDRWMRSGAKNREIRQLERERNERLRQCDMSFSKSYNDRDNRYAHNDRRNW